MQLLRPRLDGGGVTFWGLGVWGNVPGMWTADPLSHTAKEPRNIATDMASNRARHRKLARASPTAAQLQQLLMLLLLLRRGALDPLSLCQLSSSV